MQPRKGASVLNISGRILARRAGNSTTRSKSHVQSLSPRVGLSAGLWPEHVPSAPTVLASCTGCADMKLQSPRGMAGRSSSGRKGRSRAAAASVWIHAGSPAELHPGVPGDPVLSLREALPRSGAQCHALGFQKVL